MATALIGVSTCESSSEIQPLKQNWGTHLLQIFLGDLTVQIAIASTPLR